jgi:hypothetical protein
MAHHGPWCYAGEMMEIMLDAQDGDRMRERPYHITLYMHVIFILSCILFCLDLIAR